MNVEASPRLAMEPVSIDLNAEPIVDSAELVNRGQIIDRMLEVMPSQEELSPLEHDYLRNLTDRLVSVTGAHAVNEYDRYRTIGERHIDLDEQAVRTKHQGKTILVTGGTGQIGTALMHELERYNPGRLISLTRGKTPVADPTIQAEYWHADISDGEAVKAVIEQTQPDIIYHLAAQKHPSIAEQQIPETLTTNILGTNNIIEAAKQASVPQIVHASTGKALRPHSPDTYAASKKASEWLMSTAAQEGDTLISSARFTHVADNSVFGRKLHGWIDDEAPIRLHGPDILFYLQSSRESAQLLLAASLEAEPSKFNMLALNNLDYPVNLTDIAVGALAKTRGRSPIYFSGYEPGYEETPYPHLYDPMLAGEVSPLISGLEAHDSNSAKATPQIDTFSLGFGDATELRKYVDRLYNNQQSATPQQLKTDLDDLSWSLLDARLKAVPTEVIDRTAKRIARQPSQTADADHHRTDQVLLANSSFEPIIDLSTAKT
ncbi:MAG TPA: SDR family NAD(P)-dependent oxidoreductase [Candidatus Saccharimonadales bacterium]|nr:SDR family NAD(P)-dependent oxidoreductase [Candidatus Saccharimonadales bacterium]